jgi:hypothetical protein
VSLRTLAQVSVPGPEGFCEHEVIGQAQALSDLVETLQREIEDRLSENGWTVEATVSQMAPRFSVSFEHPLTSDVVLSLDSEQDYRGAVERFLASPEFDVVAKAPSDTPHARLIRAIRENAKGMDWPPSVIERLALILGLEGDSAGAAWSLGVRS